MYLWIAVVMLVAGILGGAVNYFRLDGAADSRMPAWQCVVVGVAAAFIVPLFLNMISSGLLADILGTSDVPGNASGLFVLAGFCLVAAISSRQFIDNISERVMDEARKATEKASQAEAAAADAVAAVDATSEPDEVTPDRGDETLAEGEAQGTSLTEQERLIMNAMVESSYNSRSLAGLAKQTGLPADQISPLLASLMATGMVDQRTTRSSQPRWFLTTDGRIAVARA